MKLLEKNVAFKYHTFSNSCLKASRSKIISCNRYINYSKLLMVVKKTITNGD